MTNDTEPKGELVAAVTIFVHSLDAKGKGSLRGICSNGAVTPALPIRTHSTNATRADVKKTVELFEDACAKFKLSVEDEGAFSGILKGFMSIKADAKTNTHTTHLTWRCGSDEGETLRQAVRVSSPGAPLPTPTLLQRHADTMNGLCTGKIFEAAAR